MEFNKVTNPFHLNKQTESYRISFEQDAIFFGSECIKTLLGLEDTSSIIDWHIKEGDLVLQDQVCASLFLSASAKGLLKEKSLEVKDLIKTISYLSGVKTLARCYAEQAGDVPIVGSHTQSFKLWDWELKALKSEAIIASPYLPESICKTKKDLDIALKNEWSCIALSSKIPFDDIESWLDEIPSSTTIGVYGNIPPKDIPKWSRLDIQAIWPELLQGNFPYAKVACNSN